MERLFEFIERKKQDYVQLPLFTFMQDQAIPPLQRLGFAPCMAHFIMSFGDLNRHAFREQETAHQLHDLLDEYTNNGNRHWSWFLADLKKLGFYRSQDFTEALRFLWGEETKITRQLSYQLSACMLQAQPIQKIAIIEAVETTGNVLFELTTQVALEIQSKTRQRYQYFGDFHFKLETTYAVEEPDFEALKSIEIPEDVLQECFELVEKVFEMFAEWTEELRLYAHKHSHTLPQLSSSSYSNSVTFDRWRATE